jgi:hypothetical protein
MNRSIGHLYRASFAVVSWIALVVLFFLTHGGKAIARHPNLRITLISLMLLNVSFSIFTFVIWLADVGRNGKRK